MKNNDLLGLTARDRITGFTGIITGVVDYVSGCRQGLVTPPVHADGKMPDSQWLDVQRLKVTNAPRVVLENDLTPGRDRVPPIR